LRVETLASALTSIGFVIDQRSFDADRLLGGGSTVASPRPKASCRSSLGASAVR
jgi:hypothetical protein